MKIKMLKFVLRVVPKLIFAALLLHMSEINAKESWFLRDGTKIVAEIEHEFYVADQESAGKELEVKGSDLVVPKSVKHRLDHLKVFSIGEDNPSEHTLIFTSKVDSIAIGPNSDPKLRLDSVLSVDKNSFVLLWSRSRDSSFAGNYREFYFEKVKLSEVGYEVIDSIQIKNPAYLRAELTQLEGLYVIFEDSGGKSTTHRYLDGVLVPVQD